MAEESDALRQYPDHPRGGDGGTEGRADRRRHRSAPARARQESGDDRRHDRRGRIRKLGDRRASRPRLSRRTGIEGAKAMTANNAATAFATIMLLPGVGIPILAALNGGPGNRPSSPSAAPLNLFRLPFLSPAARDRTRVVRGS